MKLSDYYEQYGSRITQDSERLFVEDFLYPLVGDKIGEIIPQFPFLDRTGRSRRIDFACKGSKAPLALEVNGETYHAEGIIPNEMFDDNLFRQNEILRSGYRLVRFSYSQLKDPKWRPVIMATLRDIIGEAAPELLSAYSLEPTEIQNEALDALKFFRDAKGWQKAVVVMPTGTGKTILSALDAQRIGGKILFLVHRLDILAQSVEAFRMVWPTMNYGYLTGEVKENVQECDILFASKDTLRQPDVLSSFQREHFDYIIVDEVHHGQSPTYRDVLDYFRPGFMLGMTATPDRLDRKDIFELFDYNKAYEIAVSEVIERGLLVPYSYYGLTDDIDYTKIRHQNNKYRVDDLERHLIIPERNQAILEQYREKGTSDKAIGFCVSIKHAERMAEFFNDNDIPAAAIHSEAPERDRLVKDFRENRLTVAFTVDLFNEGVDFPNVQVLLFLRPTESKTVFVQQLGRGLRLAPGKERVRVLDFIGNYKKANLIRDYLSKGKKVETITEDGKTRRKIEYEYSTGCEVHFDADVQEILDRQDREALGVGKLELTEAYYELAEQLGRKPSRADIDENGEYKSAKYAAVFGSWAKFIREIGEYTEASYHYPQGTHLGHVLSIVWHFGLPSRNGTAFEDKYIRLRGNLGEGRISTYRRQLKYKLQAAMELGLLEDDRRAPSDREFIPSLTPAGRELRTALKDRLGQMNLTFPLDEDGLPSSRMADDEETYNSVIRSALVEGGVKSEVILRIFLNMHAVQQMMAFLYQVGRQESLARSYIYENFFQAPFVKQFLEREGIEEATLEASKRRCPFLLNILSALGITENSRSEIKITRLLIAPFLLRPHLGEPIEEASARQGRLQAAWPTNADSLSPDDLSILRELFGADFLTPTYLFQEATFVEEI